MIYFEDIHSLPAAYRKVLFSIKMIHSWLLSEI
jgi:hypothetical protein